MARETFAQRHHRQRLWNIQLFIDEIGKFRPYRFRWRYRSFGIACRIPSAKTKGKDYRVVLRTHPNLKCKCSCPDYRNHQHEQDYGCKHIRLALRQWNEKGAYARVAALQRGDHLPNADKGLEIIVNQTKFAPIRNLMSSDRIESVNQAISAGYVTEDKNWEHNDAFNGKRYDVTDAGHLRWLHIRSDRALQELSSKVYREKIERTRADFGLRVAPNLTNPTNEI
jgi:hypothetical protein